MWFICPGLNRCETSDGRWHLYDITKDLEEKEPLEIVDTAVFSDLLAVYDSYARENGVISGPQNYKQPAQILRAGLKGKFKNTLSRPSGLLFTLILVKMIILLMARSQK